MLRVAPNGLRSAPSRTITADSCRRDLGLHLRSVLRTGAAVMAVSKLDQPTRAQPSPLVYRPPKMRRPSICSTWRTKRYLFSSSSYGRTKATVRPGSTDAQMKCGPGLASTCRTRPTRSSTVSTYQELSIPAPRATAAKSSRSEADAVGAPPDASYDLLSQQMWTRFLGWCRPIVASEPRFIHSEPSPSKTTTRRCGSARARPRPIEEHRPSVLTCRLASPGWIVFHSGEVEPFVVTNSSSVIRGAIACIPSSRSIGDVLLQNRACQEQRYRSLRGVAAAHRLGDLALHVG